MLCIFPQLGLPKGVVTVYKYQWLGRRLARGRFPQEPSILKILHKDCFIWAKVPNLEVPRLPGLVPQARI